MTWPGGPNSNWTWTSKPDQGQHRDKNTADDPACIWCEGPLGKSPSDDWCSQDCQAQWHVQRTAS